MEGLARQWYARLARGRVVWQSLLITALGLGAASLLQAGQPKGSPGPVDLQLAFTQAKFAKIVAQWGPSGVRLYRLSTLGLDYLFPIAYALCLSSAIAWLGVRAVREPERLLLALFSLPWLAAALDYIENTLHLVLLSDTSHFPAPLVLAASVAAAFKWLLIAFALGVVLYLAAARLRRPA